ncbi:MAG: C4-type zinc ribbon domain-containing protein [Bacteroides sp.]|nr:C4-type zinc ribbon domain-containing protein [Roseburia sp.]MCM1345941.1 C4-type zinc ribbon domain-containing protein [Bacteroides sp.]MCM1420305.1 C4-type zinc ribbon domain-containing protein [Bacteroides sp.]
MAKKKEVQTVDMSVEEKLKSLFQLQTMLSEIDKIRILRGELPLEVEDLEDEIEGLKTRIDNTNEEIETVRGRINELKTKIELANEKLAGYKSQLDNVRNNREYDLLNKEIEFQTLEIELCSKRIREAGTAEKSKEELVEKSRQMLEERSQDLEVKKNELDEIVAETKAEEEKLREKAKNLELSIDPRLLMSFKRIRKNSRNGLGIVYVQRDACGGCFAKIPPQRQLDVRMRKKIIVCEYCGRILIDPELAGIKPVEPKEEKPKRRRSIRTTKPKDASSIEDFME